MTLGVQSGYGSPADLPPWAVALLALASVAAWTTVGPLRRRGGAMWRNYLAPAARVAVGFVALLAVAQAARHVCLLTTSWPIWPMALGAALAVETMLWVYRLERGTIPRRLAIALASLRAATILLVVAMLAQPVFSLHSNRRLRRAVAVLVDDSASMHVAETQMTPAEKVRLAELLLPEAPRRPHRLDSTVCELRSLKEQLTDQADWLASLRQTPVQLRQAELVGRRETLHAHFADAHAVAEVQIGALHEAIKGKLKIDDKTLAALTDAAAKLGGQVRDRMAEATKLTAEGAAGQLHTSYERILNEARHAAASLAELTASIDALARTLDAAFYAALSPERRAPVDALAAHTRAELVRRVLTAEPSASQADPNEPSGRWGVLARLKGAFALRAYSFATETSEVDLSSRHGDNPTPTEARLEARRQLTDLAGALRKTASDLRDEPLAGIVLLTDGRHNAPGPVESVARELAGRNVPIFPIVVGSRQPPTDAAIVHVEAPDVVYAKDKIRVAIDVKLDGLAGKEARVVLYDRDRQADSATVRATSASFRTKVLLADTPDEPGLHHYRVVVDEFDSEAFQANNAWPLTVKVSADRVRLLLIEGRPRWEFRYLKNLFADRDRSVKLQYILCSPDRIEGHPERPAIRAAADRPDGRVEATALPADQAEWMKFDVIILGDVDPRHLTPADVEAIRKFVVDRGGTLVCIAGSQYMPHAYAGTAIESLLGVEFRYDTGRPAERPDEGFRVALSAEGRCSVLMQQEAGGQAPGQVWESAGEFYWRHPMIQARPSATVLAYAMPTDPPPFLEPIPANASLSNAQQRQLSRLRRQFELQRALVVTGQVAAGRVMFLGFDRTWRLRYGVGDVYHHRFWGQVLRWATAEKLPAGTELVKLGTDRSRYGPGEKVSIRAKLIWPDLSPLVSKNVEVTVLRDDLLVLRKGLEAQAGSTGMFSAQIGGLGAGTYRVELDAPDAKPLMMMDETEKVATEFSVEATTPAEQVELGCDRQLLGRLAELTGGQVYEPAQMGGVLGRLGPGAVRLSEVRELSLWDSWLLVGAIVALVTVEWLLRKKAGLA